MVSLTNVVSYIKVFQYKKKYYILLCNYDNDDMVSLTILNNFYSVSKCVKIAEATAKLLGIKYHGYTNLHFFFSDTRIKNIIKVKKWHNRLYEYALYNL